MTGATFRPRKQPHRSIARADPRRIDQPRAKTRTRGARTRQPIQHRAGLREQLRAQKQRYETEIADLKPDNKRLERALAAAHGELRRRGHTGTSANVGDTVTDNTVPHEVSMAPIARG